MRVFFQIPDEPSDEIFSGLGRTLDHYDSSFREKVSTALYEYFIDDARPQTAMLPRNLVKRTVAEAVAKLARTAEKFPIFKLRENPRKFVRCSYSQIWRSLLREWKARMYFGIGKTPLDQKMPRKFEPWVDLEARNDRMA